MKAEKTETKIETKTYITQRRVVIGKVLLPKGEKIELQERQAEFLLNDGSIVAQEAVAGKVVKPADVKGGA